MSISTLVIGLGQIGMGYDLELDPAQYVYSHARAFSLHPDFELVGGVDQNAEQRQVFEIVYQCPSFSSLEGALSQTNPQCVVIATPTQFHCEFLLKVIELSQPRIILCEKPLSYDLKESQMMIEACESKGIQLYVNYMRISEPGANEVKRRLQADEIMQPLRGIIWYSKGFLHNGSHFFNLIEYWLGDVIDTHLIQAGRDLLEGDAEPDVHVRFEFGDVVFMAVQEENFSHCAIELVAQNGCLRYENGGRRIVWQPVTMSNDIKGYIFLSKHTEHIPSELNRYQWYVVEELSKSLNGKEVALCSGKQALHTLEHMQLILGKR